MTVLAPKNGQELEQMLEFAISHSGPCAIRYPRGTAYDGFEEQAAPVVHGKSEVLFEGKDIAILSVGSMTEVCEKVYYDLKKDGYDPTFINARFVKPLDSALLDELSKTHRLFVTVD